MSRTTRSARVPLPVLYLLLLVLAAPASARTLLKVATLVPEGSVWHQAFAEMADGVKAGTSKSVEMRLYPGGVAGDEPDMVRKMRIGQLHGAVLTGSGLAEIDSRFEVFGVPLLIRSYDELWFLLDRLEPELSAALEENGFHFVHWGSAGWAQLFSKEPVVRVDDLRKVKLFTWAGDDRMVQWWKRNGFHPVALAATDVMTGLQTGMIEGLATTPLAALTLQWFRLTPHMLDLGLGPLVGATVLTQKAWEKLSPAEQKVLLEAGERAETRLREQIPAKDADAVAEMEKRGLTVHRIEDPAVRKEWDRTGEELATSMRGSMVPAKILDEARRELEAFRSGAGGGSP